MVTFVDVRIDKCFVFQQSAATFFMVETVAHWLAVWADHRQVHFRDYARQDAFYGDCFRNDCLDAFGSGLIELCDLGALFLGSPNL